MSLRTIGRRCGAVGCKAPLAVWCRLLRMSESAIAFNGSNPSATEPINILLITIVMSHLRAWLIRIPLIGNTKQTDRCGRLFPIMTNYIKITSAFISKRGEDHAMVKII